MAYTTLASGLTIKVPTDGTQNWGPTMKSDTFQKISEHDHTGSGKGLQIGSSAIIDAAITVSKLGTNSVSTVKIQDSAITTSKILNANVTTAKIANSAITNPLLATDAVQTANILNANVTSAKIADGNITTVKILDDNVTTAKILDSNVTANKLASNAVTTAKIADNNVTAAKLISGINIPYTKDSGLVAAGANQANATLISGQFSNVSGGSGGVRLPTPSVQDVCFLYNTGVASLNLYPQSGGTINSLSANTPITVTQGHGAVCFAYGSTAWVVLVV